MAASTLLLKRRIRTAQNVSKTTRAMQMIAASKLKRAQQAALSSRPYVENLTSLAKRLTNKLEGEEQHPYMKQRNETHKTLLIVISPDKGLCGGLITNLIKEYLSLKDKNLAVITIGKKLEGYVLRHGKEIVASFPFGTTLPLFSAVYPLSKLVDEYFLNNRVDTVEVLGSHFASIFTQKPVLERILPVSLTPPNEKEQVPLYLFEPAVSEILPSLLKHYLEMTLYQKLLEGYLSEQAARMIAMQNATTNAKDVIGELTLEYNKARQEKITREILDISGVFAYA